MKNTRRNFVKNLGGSMLALSTGSALAANSPIEKRLLSSTQKITANNKIHIGLIGCGIIGHYDTDTALKVDGVELAAVCDLYNGRLDRAKEKWGNRLFTTRDYREVLAKPILTQC